MKFVRGIGEASHSLKEDGTAEIWIDEFIKENSGETDSHNFAATDGKMAKKWVEDYEQTNKVVVHPCFF